MTIEIISERKLCPEWFQALITQAGGTNRYGTPNFDIVWSQTATELYEGGEVLQYHGEPPCWLLRKWFPPEDYGSKEDWYEQVSMPFPIEGRYEIIQPFVLHSVVNGRLHKESYPLSTELFADIVQVLRNVMGKTYDEQRKAVEEDKARKEAEQERQIADALESAAPQFTGPTSFPNGEAKTLVQRKMDQIEENFRHSEQIRQKHGNGLGIQKLNSGETNGTN